MSRNTKLNCKKYYKKYEIDVIEAALREYEESKSSFKIIATKHNVPKSVLHRHYTRFMKKQGGQTVLNKETEKYILKYLNVSSEWGYPLDTYDLRLLVKGYLDRVGTEVKRFKNNMPGPDFVRSFLSRHKEDVSLRLSQNIKRARAAVSPEKINQYFAELRLSLEGVPLQNIVNYDETNLSDDPGRRKIICKRGVKYPERIMNHSKGSTSLMIAAGADGTLLPPYVVYKSQHLYDTWTTGGPKGCRYNRTTSGWFDGTTFEEWVQTVVYSYFKDKPGKKIFIGDNLSSHLSINLIHECKERDIHFVFLPSNSTHLTQPLDVAFFRPMKLAWRDILFNWKKLEGRTQATVPKSCFPQLLKKLLQRLDDNAKQNILSGFSKAGICPLDRKRVLDRLPNNYGRDNSIFSKESVDNTVLSMLKEMRYGTGAVKVCNKKKKLNIIPGKSVGSESEYAGTDLSDSDNEIASLNQGEKTLSVKIMKKSKVGSNKNDNKNIENSSSIGNSCDNKNTAKSTNVETIRETHNIEADHTATEDKKKLKGKGIGKKSVKKHKEQKENERNIKNKIERIVLNVNNSRSECSFRNVDKANVSDVVKKYSNRSVINEKNCVLVSNNLQNEVIKVLDEVDIFKIPSPPMKANKNYVSNEKKKRGKEIESINLREEQQQKRRKKINAMTSNENRLHSKVSEDLDIENMPVFFDDDILLSEVIVNVLPNKKENISSKIKILSDENVSNIHFSDNSLHLKRVSLTDPIKTTTKKKEYYKKDEDILRDLMEIDF